MPKHCFLFFFVCISFFSRAQDTGSLYQWKVAAQKVDSKTYDLVFSTPGKKGWQLYAPNQNLADVPTTELSFADSSISLLNSFKDSGSLKTVQSSLFGIPVKLYEASVTWRHRIRFADAAPSVLAGTLTF